MCCLLPTHVTVYKNGSSKELPNKDECAVKKQKLLMLEVRLELNVNGVVGEITDGEDDTAAVPELK